MIALNSTAPVSGVSVQQMTAAAPAVDAKGLPSITPLSANPTIEEVDEWRQQISTFVSTQAHKYAYEPEGENWTKVEALGGFMVSQLCKGSLRSQMQRMRDQLEETKEYLASKRARLAVLTALPIEARLPETEAEILQLENAITRLEAEIAEGRNNFQRAPGVAKYIIARVTKGLPHVAEAAINAAYTGEDPLTWVNWIAPHVRHTRPAGKSYAEHLITVIGNALSRRQTGLDPQYDNYEVRASIGARQNENTMTYILQELRGEFARFGAELTPLRAERIFEEQCDRHGRRTVRLLQEPSQETEPLAKRSKGPAGFKAPPYAGDVDATPIKAVKPAAAAAAPAEAGRDPPPAADREARSLVSAHGSSWAVQSSSPGALAAVMQRMAELGYPQYPPAECWNCAGDPSVPASERLHWAFLCPKRPPHAPRHRWVRQDTYTYDDSYEDSYEDEYDEAAAAAAAAVDEVCGRCGETGHHHSACSDPPTRAKGKAPLALPAPEAE
eukprot:tig00000520_g1813.t1